MEYTQVRVPFEKIGGSDSAHSGVPCFRVRCTGNKPSHAGVKNTSVPALKFSLISNDEVSPVAGIVRGEPPLNLQGKRFIVSDEVGG